ncbi:hypothetical protein LOZ12_004107 [Ophidiomyces ophidiicola]|uniref:Uncharacterized protein n=1 Tax=Ophidiomyces ophidiicola TaxID=1387563 RepID=A0ACB8UU92_9EURO|nr:hypothetical protein LOZ64_006285 [Ophidiomyces ophidiicola]KAI1944351.1 hypothetical protein LOZ62_004223 [Ophidiomyces ophidiicola]KAI1973391.1 hypothetical protein LOZ56_001829 [Ophidiomyces ophidiicola]KAI2004509.1 hypothetical protein LOZ50_004218 [Ophidiomyces ophidiicola]KAI2019641.1 hypothetical protein LOZ46_003282 [Ophidiomyces ophidiicola]
MTLSAADASDSSDYGPDFSPEEEELLIGLLDNLAADRGDIAIEGTPARAGDSIAVTRDVGIGVLESVPKTVADIEDVPVSAFQASGGQPLSPTTQKLLEIWDSLSDFEIDDVADEKGVEHPNSIEGRETPRRRDEEDSQQQAVDATTVGNRTPSKALYGLKPKSPLERFRKAPKKNLSVTDLISPAWCELQYWYSLTKHGRKRPTPAMRKGSAVHKTLEEQVHTTVPVEILTREDGWALRIWNVIQGLHTLRTTGMTRELEVWGVIDGEMVTGIIDELSYDCPDAALEAALIPKPARVKPVKSLTPGDQMSFTDYMLSAAGGGKTLQSFAAGSPGGTDSQLITDKKIYITDVKTRRSAANLPTVSSVGFRPTLLQLHLYFHMLTRLATSDDITMESIGLRYRLDIDQPFSDSFIAQVDGFDNHFLDFNSSPESLAESFGDEDLLDILVDHNSLSSLWSLMKEHLRLTLLPTTQVHGDSPSDPSVVAPTAKPDNDHIPDIVESSPSTILSPLLTASYVYAPTGSTDAVTFLGSRSFFFDENDLYPYLADGMRFWRGDRNAQGVGREEAWKCRICEFRDECEWRGAKENEVLKRGRRNDT